MSLYIATRPFRKSSVRYVKCGEVERLDAAMQTNRASPQTATTLAEAQVESNQHVAFQREVGHRRHRASSVQHTGRDSMYTDVKTEASSIQTFVDAAAWSAAPFHRPPTRQSTVSSQGRALL